MKSTIYIFERYMWFITVFVFYNSLCLCAKAITTLKINSPHSRNIIHKVYPISNQDSLTYSGKVLDENGQPLIGATISVKGTNKRSITNTSGSFIITGSNRGTLVFSYIGYLTQELTLAGQISKNFEIKMVPGQNQLGEVNIVSTGYQDIPKERATGSFEVVTKEQLQHSTDPNLIRRLEGITTSMNFNNQLVPNNSANYNSGFGYTGLTGVAARSPLANLTIRGRNTLNVGNTPSNTSGQVLVVIDGIATPYSVDQIDPNDVESITVLKDAAAASIWGSRAANGVIVIKSKRGVFQKPLTISFNGNFNVSEKIDLFYKDYMSTSDFIDAQIFQFNAAGTSVSNPNIRLAQYLISPVAEILNDQKQGRISSAEAKIRIDALRNNDLRNDLTKYILRPSLSQNYSLSLDGGTKKLAYRLSVGANKTHNNTKTSGADRINLNYNNTYRPIRNLELQANLTFSHSTTNDQSPNSSISAESTGYYFPYTKLADENGSPLTIPFRYTPAFLNLLSSTYKEKIPDLTMKPLEDIKQSYIKTKSNIFNLNLGANYALTDILSATLNYNYSRGYSEQNMLDGVNSFYMRDLVAKFTSRTTLVQNIPAGARYSPTIVEANNQTIRGQLNLNKNWKNEHTLSAIAGMDITQNYSFSRANQYYGYNESTLRNQTNINYASTVTLLFGDPASGLGSSRIPTIANGLSDVKIRTFSAFSNIAYTYKNKYTLSGSIREDFSSEFGYGRDRPAKPFFSVGASWNIANENFYSLDILPRLQFRSTFGYNGNVNPSVISRATIGLSSSSNFDTNLFYATTIDQFGATNRNLRPEKTAILNVGLDFGFKNNKVSGSLEYYDKKTTDLLTNGQLDPTTGFSVLTFNTASLHGWGTDLNLNSINLQRGLFNWTTNFLLSYNRVKVTKLYGTSSTSAGQVVNIALSSFNEGADLSRLFAYRWAGLDPLTGDPRGYIDGQPAAISSTSEGLANLQAIRNAPSSTAKYFGSSVPVYFGSLRNTFGYGQLSLSFNLLYKLGYYFRRPQSDIVNYSNLFQDNMLQGIEYTRRWQKPGDELITNVPSFTYPTSQDRDQFYYNSEINVQKA
ncbi:SusC/RagA family TonB-linked outer membrane protein, partial [Pedobacter sp. MR2016-24]|uniref:SusC/RagA family TonB-linked outer membrane protein n=1 Tax=Pedobacter sp. MR2016-24 TaxID=2994466 RepID=UPI00224813C8